MTGKRRFKYLRQDFGELPVVLEHLDIYLNFIEDRVETQDLLHMTANQDFQRLELDADDLEIKQVEWSLSSPGSAPMNIMTSLDYEYLRDRKKLILAFPRSIKKGERFKVRTVTHCFPSDHNLEGIYKDATPPGAPQQYMSQCQQWGFQRIMPIVDDCRAKCTMTTTMEADAAYSHLISNGNISRRLNPDGKPVPKPGDVSRQTITFENPVPMAPYLFLACVGTWETLADKVIYDSGRTVGLEYLVPPGTVDGARISMEILKEAILWIARTQGYEYTGDTYRTICMTKSNFGGMENVGNTTIVTDAALITEHTLDLSLLYAHAVIVHEFEHNQCGSETTMETPFDVWLNEAYTVDVERRFMAAIFNPSFIRLNQVDVIRNPLLGPLAMEDAGHVGRIVREGFNHPDELIDTVTYVKAAEVIRMLCMVLGKDAFQAGKTLYFSRYHHGNANTDQFFRCFEETSGVSLERFKQGWLYGIGYPKVTAEASYEPDTARFRLHFEQQTPPGQAPFHIPIELALVSGLGEEVAGSSRVFQLKEAAGDLVFDNLPEAPAFASLNRDWSFYGTFELKNVTQETLVRQIRIDTNACSRIEAMRQFTDQQRVRLLEDQKAVVDEEWLSVYGEILRDEQLPAALKAFLLRIDEQPLERRYCTWYQELVVAREQLMLAVNKLYRDELLSQFNNLDTYSLPPERSPKHGIEERLLKQVLLDLITVDDSEESHRLIIKHFRRATTANDRVSALLALNRSASTQRRELLYEVYDVWHGHLSGYANYLRVIASGTRDDVFPMIKIERERPTFDVTQPTWCRALYLPMAVNNKMVWMDRGIQWVAETVIELAALNTTTASRILNTFQHVRSLKPGLKQKVRAALEEIAHQVPEGVSPTIHGQAGAYLISADLTNNLDGQ
jgi:aminopeptidase N